MAYTNLVTLTHPDKLEQTARIIELRVACGLTYREIGHETGLGLNAVNNIINKYKAKVTGRNLTVTISSKLNS